MQGVPFLKGERVTLRTITRADAPKFLRWINDPVTSRFLLRGDFPLGWDDEMEWIDKVARRKEDHLSLGIEVPEFGLVGNVSLKVESWIDRVATTGTMIGEAATRGKGYGTEAKMLLLGHAFRRLNLRKVYSNVCASNEASHRCQLRCGYVEEGRYRDDLYREGRYHDLLVLSATRESFEAAEAAWKEKRVTQQEGLIMDFSGSAVPRLFH